MKSTVTLALSLLLALFLVACPSDDKKEEDKAAGDSSESKEGSGTKEDSGAKDGSESKSSEPSRQDLVKTGVQELLDLVKAGDNKSAASRIVYRGPDKKRKWKDVCDYEGEMEKSYVDGVCKKISGILAKGDLTFVKFMSEKEREGEWLIWEIKVGDEKMIFAMLEIEGKFALGDID